MAKYQVRIDDKPARQIVDLEIFPGIIVTADRITTEDMAIARSRAEMIYRDIENGIMSIEEAGFDVRVQCDLLKEGVRNALLRTLTIRELGKAHIKSWVGVVDIKDDSPLPVNEQNVVNFLDVFPMGDAFFEKLTTPAAEIFAAKEELSAAANG